MTKSKRNRDEARDAKGVRHGASEHKRGKSWKGVWRGLEQWVKKEGGAWGGADLFASLSKMGSHWNVLKKGCQT